MKLQSTSGQSTVSVIITVFGKTMDFLVTYGLNMPLEYVVMCYFSSSTAFINGFQVCMSNVNEELSECLNTVLYNL